MCLSLCNDICEPTSKNEDTSRKEYILNVILFLSLSALSILGITLIWNFIHIDGYSGMHPFVFICITIIYAGMLYLSKTGFAHIAIIILVFSNIAGTLYTGWHWGASLPETLLLAALTIVSAGVLIGSTTGFVTAGAMILSLAILSIHEYAYLNIPCWRYDKITITDVITYSVMFLFISFIAWLSNREIEKSLLNARTSKKMLEIERNSLEKKVSKRTRELIEAQKKILFDYEHIIQIGKNARGIIHDIVNPLSAISLYIEELERQKANIAIDKKHILISKAYQASCRMKTFLETIQHHIDPIEKQDKKIINVADEIMMVKDILSYKARINGISIFTDLEKNIKIKCHPLDIHRAILNLISNGIDACIYSNKDTSLKNVTISLKSNSNSIIIIVKDTGCGISYEKINDIFNVPHTTKSHGTGLGLIIVKSIVTDNLAGKISVESISDQGTSFIISIPKIKHKMDNT